jgi:hypothetical protein
MMGEVNQSDIRIINDPAEGDLTAPISAARDGALTAIRELWGLAPPPDCRIFVMTSWWKFFMDAAPWYTKLFLIRAWPFWLLRAQKLWPLAGAWTQKFGSQVAIGVKPPRLLASSDTTIGQLIFEEEPDLQRKLQQLVCHELTHACAAHLGLPAWLNEGIAMLTVDRFAGRRTVRMDTLDRLRANPPRCQPPGYRQLAGLEGRSIALHTVRGYWLIELVERRLPGFFKRQFAAWKGARALERDVAGLLGLPVGRFWEQVDDVIA